MRSRMRPRILLFLLTQVRGNESCHGHFKEGRLSGTGRSRYDNVIIAVTNRLRQLRLKGIEGLKSALPEKTNGWLE